MEFEQIVKQLEWLDEEHRKDKETITELETQLKATKSSLTRLSKQFKEWKGDATSLTALPARMDLFEASLNKRRNEIIEVIEGKNKTREQQIGRELNQVNQSIAEFRKSFVSIDEIQSGLKARAEQEVRLTKLVSKIEQRVENVVAADEEIKRELQLFEENWKQQTKHISDLQGEISTMRKRMEELHQKGEINADGIRRIGTRLAAELDHRQAEINQQAQLLADREQAWRDWKSRFDKLGKEADTIEANLIEWDATQRAARRAQESYEELLQKFERRINELGEMQRLTEDRFRQEWVTFNADDQKRWSSYTLLQDERNRSNRSDMEKLGERMTTLEDVTQNQQDIIQQSREAEEEYLQGVMAQIHELLSAYERIMGSGH